MKKLSDQLIKFRWIIIALFVLITVFFAFQLPKNQIESDVKSQLPDNMPSRITLDKIESIFGGTDIAMIIIQNDDILDSKTLRRVKKISRGVERIKGVDRVLSLFELKEIVGEQGAMIVNPAAYTIPSSKEEREEMRGRIKDNDIVYGTVVSKDFKSTAVIALLTADANDSDIAAGMRNIVKKFPGKEKIVYGGILMTREAVGRDIKNDMQKFMPFGLLIMLVFLFLCFRQLRGVVLPFVVVIMSIIVSMGIIPLFGWKIQIVTILLPVILIAVANDYGIHILSKYQEDNTDGSTLTEVELAKKGFESLGKPVVATGVTTIAGMLCLLSHIIVPAEELGILASAGILFALAASLFFIPAVLSLLPKAKPIIKESHEDKHRIEKMLHSLADFVAGKPKHIIAGAVLIAIIVSAGICFIVVDTNPDNYYSDDSPVVQASAIVNKEFGGSTSISVTATGDIKDPGVLKKIDALEHRLRDMPEIGTTTSIARVVKQMSRALNDKDDPRYNRIPSTRNAVAQYFELYNMSGDPDDFEQLVDFNYKNAQISARINSTSSEVIKRTVERIEKIIKNDPLFTRAGGFAAIFSELVTEVVNGQVKSLLLSLITVALIVMLLFRSPAAGLISAIPLAQALLLLFGLMGYAGIELNIATAMLSSIMVGVGIDYTIHFLWRYREEREHGHTPEGAVKITLTTVGRGIIFNALSVVIGFIVLLVSNFMPVRFFGFLVVVSISTCLFAALMLLPAICIVVKPRFLEPKKIINQGE